MYMYDSSVCKESKIKTFKILCSDLKITDVEVLKYAMEEHDDDGVMDTVKIVDRYFKVDHDGQELVLEVSIRYHYFYDEE